MARNEKVTVLTQSSTTRHKNLTGGANSSRLRTQNVQECIKNKQTNKQTNKTTTNKQTKKTQTRTNKQTKTKQNKTKNPNKAKTKTADFEKEAQGECTEKKNRKQASPSLYT